MATRVSSIMVSLTTKSEPMVALYVLRNFLLTYWCSSEVLPTLRARTAECVTGASRRVPRPGRSLSSRAG